MNPKQFFQESLNQSAQVKVQTIESCWPDVEKAILAVTEVYRIGGKVMMCGNGGSAADCQHLVTELMIRLNHDVSRPALGAVSLCTDPSMMTAGGNDIGFDNVFARSVQGLGRRGDVLIGISTSGNSTNVLNAVNQAREIGIGTICLLGNDGGLLRGACDIAIVVPSGNTQRIQETHITLGHIICECVEQILYPIT